MSVNNSPLVAINLLIISLSKLMIVVTGHTDGSPFPSSQSMTSPAASNWPASPGMPRPSPARPGQSPGHPHPALHSPDHKTGKEGY